MNDVIYACVLKSGGDYGPEHVLALRDMIEAQQPGRDFVCFSDVEVPGVWTIKLVRDLPGWWSKLEMFRAHRSPETLLYFDLDTVIIGDVTKMEMLARDTDKPIILRDAYRPDGLQSAVMAIPRACCAEIWNDFSRDPEGIMAAFADRSDQEYLETFWIDHARLWQDELPADYIVSYKADVITRGLSPDNRVVFFHGKPRPWDTDLWPFPITAS